MATRGKKSSKRSGKKAAPKKRPAKKAAAKRRGPAKKSAARRTVAKAKRPAVKKSAAKSSAKKKSPVKTTARQKTADAINRVTRVAKEVAQQATTAVSDSVESIKEFGEAMVERVTG